MNRKKSLAYVILSLIAALALISVWSKEERKGAGSGLFAFPHVSRAGLLPFGGSASEAEQRVGREAQEMGSAGLDAAWPEGVPAPPPGANTLLDATQFPGSDASMKIRACFDALPASGGICDARNMDVHQNWSANPFEGQPIDKLLIVRLGSSEINLTHQITLGNDRYIVGTLGRSARGQLPSGTVFTPVAGFPAKSVFKIDPAYSKPNLSFALGAAVLDATVDMRNIPTQTWGGTVFEINSLTHQELYGLRAINNNGTFMVFGTSENAGAQWCEDLDVRDF
jgi:hypothetical protein